MQRRWTMAMVLVCAALVWVTQGEGNTKITPAVALAPNLFAVGQVSPSFACISNTNTDSGASMIAGDQFTIDIQVCFWKSRRPV